MAINVQLIPNVNQSRVPRPDSGVTKRRIQAVNSINRIAAETGASPMKVAGDILSQSVASLARYVQNKGIVPAGDYNRLSAQAALLRLQDIGETARILKLNDDQALKELEGAETESFTNNQSEDDNVLPTDVQGALLIVGKEFLKRSSAKTAKQFAATLPTGWNVNSLLQSEVNNLSGVTDGITITPPGTGMVPTEYAGAGSTTSGGSIQSWINTASGLFDSIGKLFKTGSETYSDVRESVVNMGGDIGSTSISKWAADNWYIIAGAFLLIIILIVVVARKK